MVVNVTKISQKMKKKKIEKSIIELGKTLYKSFNNTPLTFACNYYSENESLKIRKI